MKKTVSFILSTALIMGISSSAAYIDVNDSDWFSSAVNTATENKWFSGYEDGSFKPNNNITRAEAAKVIMTYKYGENLPDITFNNYTDLSGDEWYASFVNLSGQNNIIPDYSDNFKPSEYITREDTVVALAKIKGIKIDTTLKSDFTDIAEMSDYAKDYITAASKYNLVAGFEDGSFKPKNPITRAQFAQIMMNAEKIEVEATISPTEAPSAAPTVTPTPTPTASPTATPVPTPVPVAEDFKDKNIFIFGDAFVTTNGGFVGLIKNDLAPKSLKTKNSYYGGFTNNNKASIINNISEIPEDTDYIIIFSGRYDWESSLGLGDETSVQENDFTGGLNAVISRTRDMFPNAKLVICTTPNMSYAKMGFTESGVYNLIGLSIKDYADRVKLICKQKKVDVIDLNAECWSLSEMRDYMVYENMSYLKVNEEGSAKIAEVITKKLIEINKK